MRYFSFSSYKEMPEIPKIIIFCLITLAYLASSLGIDQYLFPELYKESCDRGYEDGKRIRKGDLSGATIDFAAGNLGGIIGASQGIAAGLTNAPRSHHVTVTSGPPRDYVTFYNAGYDAGYAFASKIRTGRAYTAFSDVSSALASASTGYIICLSLALQGQPKDDNSNHFTRSVGNMCSFTLQQGKAVFG